MLCGKVWMAALHIALLCILASLPVRSECSKVFGAYFPNWAQYRPSPYTYDAESLGGIIARVDHLMYAYAHFDSKYSIILTDANDTHFIKDITAYKLDNPNLKLLLSVGGHNFPSANFSDMASSQANRAAFISSVKDFLQSKSFDGLDISWQYPCSYSRTIYIKESCEKVTLKHDQGGTCPGDENNLLLLVKELRKALGNGTLITVVGPAASEISSKITTMQAVSEYIDYWHIETYDYTVSAMNVFTSSYTAPNSPLRSPPKQPGLNHGNVNDTVIGYLSAGVPASKIIPGIPLFGQAWYVPGMSGSGWTDYGLKAAIQGKCCGHLQYTYGAKYGKASQTCGIYMYSEIIAAGGEYYYDKTTQTAIGYMQTNSSDDGWTEYGTWFSFNDRNSIEAIIQLIDQYELGGAYVFDASQDSIDPTTGQFKYELMNSVYAGLHGGQSGYVCNPQVGCNVCTSCCKSYLTNQFDCDACVAVKCHSQRVCHPRSECNVCSKCCSYRYAGRKSSCNDCAEKFCK